MAKLDRHLTTEQLSALLDDRQEEISEKEREHLTGCSQCQQELDELRQTVHLLHALPQPELPRSFMLPAGITQLPPTSVEVPGASNIHILRSTDSSQRRARSTQTSTGRRVLSLAGMLAAVVGILFILSGFVPSLPAMTASTGSVSAGASSGTGAQESSSASSSTNGPVTSAGAGQQDGTPAAEQPRGVQANQVPATQNAQNASGIQSAPPQASGESKASPPAFSFLDWGATGTRIGLGILLFIAGMMGIAIGRERNREARA